MHLVEYELLNSSLVSSLPRFSPPPRSSSDPPALCEYQPEDLQTYTPTHFRPIQKRVNYASIILPTSLHYSQILQCPVRAHLRVLEIVD